MDWWFLLTGSRPVFSSLATTILALISVLLSLLLCVPTLVSVLAANLAAFCELARPEPCTTQPSSSNELLQHSPTVQNGAFLQLDKSESDAEPYENFHDDNASIQSDDSDTLVGSLSLKSLTFSPKPTYHSPDTIHCPLTFDDEEIPKLPHHREQPLFFYDSEDEEDSYEDEEECSMPAATRLGLEIAVTSTRASRTSAEGSPKPKRRRTTGPFSETPVCEDAVMTGDEDGDESEDETKDETKDEDVVVTGDEDESEAETKDEDEDEEDEDEDEEEAEDEDRFAEVKEALNLDAIKKIAKVCRAKELAASSAELTITGGDSLECEIDAEPMYGSFNLVYVIRWSDGVKWVVRIPQNGCQFTMLDVAKMDSVYGTIELIRKRTTVPIPQVFFHTWMPDRAGVPFALMSYVEGKMLCNFWHDPATTQDQKFATLASIAEYMTGLSKLRFPEAGMLYFDKYETEARVGPVIETQRGSLDDIYGTPEILPQCKSGKTALSQWIEITEYPTKRAECDRPILQAGVDSIPDFMESMDHYAIAFPDFDWQNIMVNDKGEITAFIDWDDVEVKPMDYGAGAYPLWLTRDWQPDGYNWGSGKEQVDDDGTVWHEESPEQLSEYRQHYTRVMTTSQGPAYDARRTKLSHILTTLCTGIFDSIAAGPNVNKLFRHAGVPFRLKDYADSYVKDDTAEKDDIIRQAFKKMWHAEWEGEDMVAVEWEGEGKGHAE